MADKLRSVNPAFRFTPKQQTSQPTYPLSAGQLYHGSIPGSRLENLENCGHRPKMEHPNQFINLAKTFLA